MNRNLICPILLTALIGLGLCACGASLAPAEEPAPPSAQVSSSPEPLNLESAGEAEPSETPPPTARQRAEALLEAMTTEEKVGQLFLARCPAENAVEKAAQYQLGGYILFGRDFTDKTPQQVTEQLSACQSSVNIPMIIAVDEEGGEVNRVSIYPAFRASPFLSPQSLYGIGSWAAIADDTQEKCALLQDLGINTNMAPVCDVSSNPGDFIYSRTFGQDARQTALYVETVVQVMARNHMGCVLKHFPGYGPGGDTHETTVYDNRPYSAFEESDFLPFTAGIEAGAGAVLVSHNIVTCMDPENPASLSPEVHRILREKLGFDGVILTDDLVMAAVRAGSHPGETAVKAILAGNDMLCSSEFEIQAAAVLEAVQDGTIPISRIDESVLRVLLWKIEKIGLFLP